MGVGTDDEDGTLMDVMEDSVSALIGNCTDVRYSIDFNFHELESLDVVWSLGGDVRAAIDLALREDGIAMKGHKFHEDRGTCVLSEPPVNDRTEGWLG